jgi:NAD(P)H-dependent FMN reductase
MQTLLAEQGFETDVVDASEIDLPLLERPLHHYGEGEAPEAIQALAARLEEADGFVVVAGEYNHAIQPGLSNLLDYFYHDQFGYKPGLIASYSYGPFGGVRAAMMLRAHLAELGMVTVPTTIAIGGIADSLSADGEPQKDTMKKYASTAMSELAFYTRALAAERKKGLPDS